MSVTEKFEDKRILIWGYGCEGKSTEKFLEKFCNPRSVEIFEGQRDDINEDAYDYIVKSPGIIMEGNHFKYTSQTQIFLEEFRDQTIGITGTKGKSTTTAMIYHVLKNHRDAVMVGNIGKPPLDFFGDVKKDTLVVFEMSCHQLRHLNVSPHIALFLSFFEEHLDYYRTLENYFNAKANITKYQKAGDYFFIGEGVPDVKTEADKVRVTRQNIRDYKLKILGAHNNYNAQFVEAVAKLCGLDEETILNDMRTFSGLDHRLQYIVKKNGVEYYDDSISTIPDATIEALRSVPNAKTVIIGGMDRGINYDVLIDFVEDHEEYEYVFCYDSGRRIYRGIPEKTHSHYCETLDEAVSKAASLTPEGYACILSPAAASYGYFKNFEERGDRFKELVDAL